MIIGDLTNVDILRLKSEKSIALIPVGSIEQHGPHLPVSTDSDIVSYIAKQISTETGFLLLPTVQYGVSFEHEPFFNLSLTTSTLQKILIDLCLSLWKNHINKIVILNGHHGNQKALRNVPSKVSKITGSRPQILMYSYWHFMNREFDHAGHVETSIMLAISNRVRMNRAQKGFVPNKLSKMELNRLSKLASKSFPSVTKNGVWGDPTKATLEEGEGILSNVIESIIKECQTCLTGKSRKLHQ